MDASQLIIFVVTGALFAPLITALINRPNWSRGTRQIVATIVALVLAVVVGLLTGQLTGSPLQIVVAVLGMATLAYEYLWKPTGVTETIEKATSPKIDDD